MSAGQQQAAAGAAAESFDGGQWLTEATKKMRVNHDDQARQRGLDAIQQFIQNAMQPGQVLQKDVETNIKFWINAIDQKLSTQLNEIMHHEALQKLEGTWKMEIPGAPAAERSLNQCFAKACRDFVDVLGRLGPIINPLIEHFLGNRR